MKKFANLYRTLIFALALFLTLGGGSLFAQVTVIVPASSALPGAAVLIPVNVGDLTGRNVTAYQFDALCDSTIIRFNGAEAAGTLSGSTPTVNYSANGRGPGRMTVAWASATPLTGSGVLIYLKATAQTKIGSTSVDLSGFLFNTGNPAATITNGSLRTNRAPTITAISAKTVAEKDTLRFTASSTDPDLPTDALTYSLIGAPTGASIVASTGVFTWVPDYGQNGSYTFKIKVVDLGLASDSTTVSVTVTKTNRKPVFTTKMADTTIADGVGYSFAYAATDPDAGTTLTYKLESGPTGATVTSGGFFSWVPGATQLGAFNIVVSVSDGALADTAKSKITVIHVNRAPAFVAKLATQSVNEGSTVTFTYTATDPDAGTTLVFSLVNPPAGATITSGGAFTFALPANPAASYQITAVVSDGSLTDTAKATLTVNHKPVMSSRTPATVSQISRNVATTFTVNATDPDGNTLTFAWKVNGVAESATGNTLTKTFTDGHNTAKTVTATFSDPGGLKDSTTWSFTITPVKGDVIQPTEFALGQNYPNPFNPTTTMTYALPKEAQVTFEIYNMLGVRIRTLLAGQTKSAGFYTMTWDGKDDAGHSMSSGIYLYRINAGSFISSKKMTLLK